MATLVIHANQRIEDETDIAQEVLGGHGAGRSGGYVVESDNRVRAVPIDDRR
jgi:hypothetical protein